MNKCGRLSLQNGFIFSFAQPLCFCTLCSALHHLQQGPTILTSIYFAVCRQVTICLGFTHVQNPQPESKVAGAPNKEDTLRQLRIAPFIVLLPYRIDLEFENLNILVSKIMCIISGMKMIKLPNNLYHYTSTISELY